MLFLEISDCKKMRIMEIKFMDSLKSMHTYHNISSKHNFYYIYITLYTRLIYLLCWRLTGNRLRICSKNKRMAVS